VRDGAKIRGFLDQNENEFNRTFIEVETLTGRLDVQTLTGPTSSDAVRFERKNYFKNERKYYAKN